MEETVKTILELIDNGEYGLPVFQRGYVWNREQVREFMSSLYNKYPVGNLLVWQTDSATIRTHTGTAQVTGTKKLLVDGQQRITSLYGIARGKPPTFFNGNQNSFLNLYFNLDGNKGEEFEFYSPAKMHDNPRWVNVSELIINGISATRSKLRAANKYNATSR